MLTTYCMYMVYMCLCVMQMMILYIILYCIKKIKTDTYYNWYYLLLFITIIIRRRLDNCHYLISWSGLLISIPSYWSWSKQVEYNDKNNPTNHHHEHRVIEAIATSVCSWNYICDTNTKSHWLYVIDGTKKISKWDNLASNPAQCFSCFGWVCLSHFFKYEFECVNFSELNTSAIQLTLKIRTGKKKYHCFLKGMVFFCKTQNTLYTDLH